MPSQPVHSSIAMQGHLRVLARNAETGEVLHRISIRNTITFGALQAVVQLISQPTGVNPTTLAITQLRVGTGTTPPVRGNTGLQSQRHALTLLSSQKELTLNGPYELKIVTTLEAGTAASPFNGVTLSEAGLFTASGALFARQIHPGIPKSEALVIDYDWRIAFTA